MIPRREQQGFTIVELLIVIVVIAILAAIVIVSYNGIQQKARVSAVQQEASTALKKVQAYRVMNSDTLPDTLAQAGVNNSGNTTYQYWKNPDTRFGTFCLTATSNGVSSHAASTGKTVAGPCPGHTGEAPPKLNCPAGFITVPGNALFNTDAFCVMKYEAKNSGGTPVSTAAGAPWVSVTLPSSKSAAALSCEGCHLVTANEWLTIAHNVMVVPSNWSSGTVGSGYLFSGHNDNDPASVIDASTNDNDGFYGTKNSVGQQRRTMTLTNGEVIWDLVGNAWEWIDQTTEGGQPGLASDSSASGSETYKNFNAANVLTGNFKHFFPAYANPDAASWGYAQSLGQMITSSNYDGERGFHMGGGYTTGYVNGGIFTLRINNVPSVTSNTSGFRVAR